MDNGAGEKRLSVASLGNDEQVLATPNEAAVDDGFQRFLHKNPGHAAYDDFDEQLDGMSPS